MTSADQRLLDDTVAFEPTPGRVAGDVIDGEAIIIDLETGVYYSMQGAGGLIWSLLAPGATVGAMVQAITSRYDVGGDRAAADVEAVLAELRSAGLIVAADGAGAVRPEGAQSPREPYMPPALVAYRDMQELLALDPPAPGVSGLAWPAAGG